VKQLPTSGRESNRWWTSASPKYAQCVPVDCCQPECSSALSWCLSMLDHSFPLQRWCGTLWPLPAGSLWCRSNWPSSSLAAGLVLGCGASAPDGAGPGTGLRAGCHPSALALLPKPAGVRSGGRTGALQYGTVWPYWLTSARPGFAAPLTIVNANDALRHVHVSIVRH
jgi:hypothetical protein